MQNKFPSLGFYCRDDTRLWIAHKEQNMAHSWCFYLCIGGSKKSVITLSKAEFTADGSNTYGEGFVDISRNLSGLMRLLGTHRQWK